MAVVAVVLFVVVGVFPRRYRGLSQALLVNHYLFSFVLIDHLTCHRYSGAVVDVEVFPIV